MTSTGTSVPDDPVGESLRGRHGPLGRALGRAATHAPDVATSAMPADPAAADRSDLGRLPGPGAFADTFSHPASPPAGWGPVFVLEGRQVVWPDGGRPGPGPAAAGPRVIELGQAEVSEMLDLVARTRPGPF
ncbi:hypothetical protein [Streptomyces sennicomposti]